jgi:hypothetical protein
MKIRVVRTILASDTKHVKELLKSIREHCYSDAVFGIDFWWKYMKGARITVTRARKNLNTRDMSKEKET